MRYSLMAALLVPLVLLPVAPALAQSAGTGSQANAELFYMIQQLQGEVRRLQGEVEEQRHRIDRLTEQSRDRYIDLDQRILNLASELADADKPADSTAGEEGSAGGSQAVQQKDYRAPTAEERKAYDAIQTLIREEKKFNEAINAIYDFIDKYDQGDLTVNAYYWLGEVYLAVNQLEQAKQAFTIVATRFADHRKAPDAVYKLAVTLDRLGETEEARRRMESLIANYPDSNAASLAKTYLDGERG